MEFDNWNFKLIEIVGKPNEKILVKSSAGILHSIKVIESLAPIVLYDGDEEIAIFKPIPAKHDFVGMQFVNGLYIKSVEEFVGEVLID